MLVSLNWLKTHLELGEADTAQISDWLTFAGVEVEDIRVLGVSSPQVVVGRIESFVPHPDADRLSVCQVQDGSGATRQVVCGARNFKAGDKIPLALPGAKLPGGIEIREGKLRGVLSMGMMCSARELGMGEDHGGLAILPEDAPLGTPLSQWLGNDTLLEIEVTPNRPDLLSHWGLARELAALAKLPAHEPAALRAEVAQRAATEAEVSLADPGCPYYSARLIEGVQVAESPAWLKQRLESIGLRSINSAVDVTNFVMMELGQPLHAFDADQIQGGIVVRRAAKGEVFLALDNREYALDEQDLVIASGSGEVLALAGVMGGAKSGVSAQTKRILLESATFDPSSVRRSARRLGLGSDSSYRFERGVNAAQIAQASQLACELIVQCAGGSMEPQLRVAGAMPSAPAPQRLELAHARRVLGIADLSAAQVEQVLQALGLKAVQSDAQGSLWQIPPWRLDLQRPVDLIEELARVIGLDQVPSRLTAQFMAAAGGNSPDRQYDEAMAMRRSLAARGLQEAQCLRLISQAQVAEALGNAQGQGAAVSNPLSEDHAVLRPSLIPGLLAVADRNAHQGSERLRFFEVGRVFLPLPKGGVREEERLGLLIGGPAQARSWHQAEPAAADFHDLLGLLEGFWAPQRIELKTLPANAAFVLAAELRVGNRVLGWVAQVHPARVRQGHGRAAWLVAELLPSALRQLRSGPAKFAELPRFPSITRDVAFELPVDCAAAKVSAFFEGLSEPLLVGRELFDVFRDPSGKRLGADRQSQAWSLTYRAADRTLEAAEVDAAHARVVAALTKALPATLRQ